MLGPDVRISEQSRSVTMVCRHPLRNLSRAAVGSLLAMLLLAAPALAAPPTAASNSIRAWPRGTMDVLYNDSGTDLRVTDTTAPAHGTVSCAPLGGCLYEATGDYTGPDAFDYTVTDGDGLTATATVNVTVVASPSGTDLVPQDDQTATLAGRPVTVDVLANDDGKAPLKVTGVAVNPSHGSVDCTEAGSCTYTPADGFTRGSDGFRYTVQDGNAHNATADVHLLVIPADSRFDVVGGGSSGGGTTVPVGGSADWTGGAAATGLSAEELAALALPDLKAVLGGPHAVTDGTLKLAKGWVALPGDAGTAEVKAGSGALLGDAVSEAFPKPLPPLAQGTGGDGHVPILAGSKVLAYYHHSTPTQVTCVDRRTGAVCPGYPMYVPAGTNNQPGPGVAVGSRVYSHMFPYDSAGGSTYSSGIGLFCWDVKTNDSCGWIVLDREAGGNPGASAPVSVDGKLYLVADTGKLYCYDPVAKAACGTLDTGFGAGGSEFDIVTHGHRVFVSRRYSNGMVACLDVAAKAPCPGWETPKTFGPTNPGYNLITLHDAQGAASGICVAYSSSLDCAPDADPTAATHRTDYISTDDNYSVTTEAEAGTRTLLPSHGSPGLYCWDWTTMARCVGPNFSNGFVSQDKNGGGLYYAYGAVWDGSCAVALGDSARVYTVDAQGNSPCASLSTGTNRRVIDLRDQRCDGSVGAATWKAVTLGDIQAAELTTAIVTVRDAVTDEVLATADLAGGDHRLDLSGIDPNAHPSVTIDATSTSPTGDPAWDDAIPPRLRLTWNADPQQGCFSSRSIADCSAAAGTTLAVTGMLDPSGAGSRRIELALAHDPACDPKPEVKQPDPPAPVVAASPPPRRCGGARLFSIPVLYQGRLIKKLLVTVNGKAQKVVSLKPRPVVKIDLRGLPVQTTRVKITIKTKSGKTLKGQRVYHPCTSRLPDRGFKY
jgi:hypothetical protein